MKKVIVASLVFLMIGAAVVYAESTSFVGRKVQSEAIVTLDGEQIGSVLILDGVSYAPVRVIAEASGLSAGYKKGEVMLTTKVVETETASSSEPIDVDSLTKEKSRLEIRSNTLHRFISDLTKSISEYTSVINQLDDDTSAEGFQATLDEIKVKKAEYEVELAQVSARIAEIDALLK